MEPKAGAQSQRSLSTQVWCTCETPPGGAGDVGQVPWPQSSQLEPRRPDPRLFSSAWPPDQQCFLLLLYQHSCFWTPSPQNAGQLLGDLSSIRSGMAPGVSSGLVSSDSRVLPPGVTHPTARLFYSSSLCLRALFYILMNVPPSKTRTHTYSPD